MKTILTLIFLAGAILLIGWFARPWWNDLAVLRAEKQEVDNALATLKDLQNLRDDLLKTRDSIPADKLERLSQLLPEKDESGLLLVHLEEMTGDRGIKMRRIDFSKETATSRAGRSKADAKIPEFASILSYSLAVSSTYESFKSLLAALEKHLRVIDLTEIAFSSSGQPNQILEISLKAKSYYQGPK